MHNSAFTTCPKTLNSYKITVIMAYRDLMSKGFYNSLECKLPCIISFHECDEDFIIRLKDKSTLSINIFVVE